MRRYCADDYAEIAAKVIYDPRTGAFTWAETVNSRAPKGSSAGSIQWDKRLRIRFNGKRLLAHKLAWFIVRGEVPKILDHRNGDPLDNRICNLRVADDAANAWNSRLYKTNTVGYKGVYPVGRRYYARITVRGQTKFLGGFDTKEDAALAYNKAATQYHGEFAWLNPL